MPTKCASAIFSLSSFFRQCSLYVFNIGIAVTLKVSDCGLMHPFKEEYTNLAFIQRYFAHENEHRTVRNTGKMGAYADIVCPDGCILW
jgi:hypothetical protein